MAQRKVASNVARFVVARFVVARFDVIECVCVRMGAVQAFILCTSAGGMAAKASDALICLDMFRTSSLQCGCAHQATGGVDLQEVLTH